MRKFSIGVFFNIFDTNIAHWQKQIEWIDNLGGVEHIEILLEDLSINNKEILFLKRLVSKYHIIIHAPFMDLTVLSPHKEIVEASMSLFMKAARIGEYLSAEMMTIHAERYPNFWTETQAQKQTVFWTKHLAKDSTFPISIENLSLGGNTQIPYPATVSQITQLAYVLPNNSALTIDTGHLLKHGFDVIEVLRKVKTKAQNIHLHDGKKGSAHLKLGDGNLTLKRFLSQLKEMQYEKFVTLEVIGEKNIVDSWKTLRKEIDNAF